MGRAGERWSKLARTHFDFVVLHGFEPVGVEEGSVWSTSYSYRSPEVEIRVTCSNEFGRAEVSLIRLVDGEVPPYPIFVTSEPLNHVLLDAVLEARRSPLFDDIGQMQGLGDADLTRQLDFWATALRSVAYDFLSGELAAIEEAEAVVRARVAQHPQQVVAWLPEDAPADAERALAEEILDDLPPDCHGGD